jgi:hypothetical protein
LAYFSAGSSSEAINPSETALPMSSEVTLLAIEKDKKRASSLRP